MSFNSKGEYQGRTQEDDIAEASHSYYQDQPIVAIKGFREGRRGKIVIPHAMVRVRWDNPALGEEWMTADEIKAVDE